MWSLWLMTWLIALTHDASSEIGPGYNGNYPDGNLAAKPFVVAVFEYAKEESLNEEGVIKKSLEEFGKAARKAATQNVDIIVFPECGIFPSPLKRSSHLAETVPNPETTRSNPCSEPQRFAGQPVLTNLSCLARENGLYVVANIVEVAPCNSSLSKTCPLDNQFRFNSDVVFDRNGQLVARHRKRFLFFESHTDRSPVPQLTVFDTDFGRVGVIICFDTIFEEAVQMVEKYDVDTVVVSTYWFDEFPFLSAIQYFQAWAVGNGVNLAVANLNQPSRGTLGSLITSKDASFLKYTDVADGKSKLIVGQLNSNPSKATTVQTGNSQVKRGYTLTNFENYTVVPLDLQHRTGSVKACNNGLCCRLSYSSSQLKQQYYLAATNGIMNVQHHYFFCNQVCSLFTCQGEWNDGKFSCKTFPMESQTQFDSYNLRGNMTTKHVYPSVLGTNMTLLSSKYWHYVPGVAKLSVEASGIPLLSASLHGRCYDQDPPYKP